MSRLILLSSILGIALAVCSFPASAGDWGFVAGYRFIDLDYTFDHDTHPDDGFLQDAESPGSAGRTELSDSHWVFLAGRYQAERTKSIFHLDLGLLVGGDRDDRKNDNDNRPDNNAAFIYSRANIGSVVSIGISYRMGAFSLGVEAQATAIYVESGWDRFGTDEEQDSELEFNLSVGPKIGYRFGNSVNLEIVVQFGESAQGAINLIWGL